MRKQITNLSAIYCLPAHFHILFSICPNLEEFARAVLQSIAIKCGQLRPYLFPLALFQYLSKVFSSVNYLFFKGYEATTIIFISVCERYARGGFISIYFGLTGYYYHI